MKTEAGHASLLQRMQELQEKLKANEQRERAALLKIKMLGKQTPQTRQRGIQLKVVMCLWYSEEGSEKRSKSSGADISDLKRQLKNMESQHQVL